MTIEEVAKKAAGNWKEFPSFSWSGQWELEDPDNWTIIELDHRDSSDREYDSSRRFESLFDDNPDARLERFRCWARGYRNAVSIRVFDADGDITDAFKLAFKKRGRKEDYGE